MELIFLNFSSIYDKICLSTEKPSIIPFAVDEIDTRILQQSRFQVIVQKRDKVLVSYVGGYHSVTGISEIQQGMKHLWNSIFNFYALIFSNF